MTPNRTPNSQLDPARQNAYRRLALAVLRADISTLTAELRPRRMVSLAWVRLAAPPSRLPDTARAARPCENAAVSHCLELLQEPGPHPMSDVPARQ